MFLEKKKINFFLLILKLMTADDAKFILKDETNYDLIKCIYEYWRGKRLKHVIIIILKYSIFIIILFFN
jgi:hypothetical protein